MATAVCVSVCQSFRISTLLHAHGCNLGNGMGCSVVVQYWADLQSVHGFRCYDSIRHMKAYSLIHCKCV